MNIRLGVTDTITCEEYFVQNWVDMAEFAMKAAKEDNDYNRYLPTCNDWNLDYPIQNESLAHYTERLVEMAINLQLIG